MKIKYYKLLLLIITLIVKIKCEDGESQSQSYSYCTQYDYDNKNEDYKKKIVLDENKLQELNKQYLIENFDSINGARKLNYYIRYYLVARGLCYYENGADIKSMSEMENLVDNVGNPFDIRYEKTVNCYYMYQKYIDTTVANNELKPICKKHCFEFRNSIYNMISYDSEKCPYPQNPDTMVTLGDNGAIGKERRDYIDELDNLCISLNDTEECEEDSFNLEVVNCGFHNSIKKDEYCSSDLGRGDKCCKLKYKSIDVQMDLTFNKESMIVGIATGSVFALIGMVYSYIFMKEIRTQEKIKNSIKNQEQAYQQKNQQMRENAYNNGYNPENETFNSSSRNLANAQAPIQAPVPIKDSTLRSNRPTMSSNKYSNGSETLYSPMSTLSSDKSRQYPPNCYVVSQDNLSNDKRDIKLKRGMIVKLIQRYEGGWVTVMDIQTNRQGYAPEFCLGKKIS